MRRQESKYLISAYNDAASRYTNKIKSSDMKLINSLLFFRTISSFLLIASIGLCAYAGNIRNLDGDLFTTGQEPSVINSDSKNSNIHAWPLRETSSVNISNLDDGGLVIVYSENGQVVAKATAGNDDFVQIDLSDIEPEIYTVHSARQESRNHKTLIDRRSLRISASFCSIKLTILT